MRTILDGRMRHGRMSAWKRTAQTVSFGFLAIVGLVAGSTVASAAADSQRAVKLGPKLLTISQTPTGWSVTSGGVNSGCLAQIPSTTGLTRTASADVQFNVPGGVANGFEEKLVVFSGPAKNAYARIVRGFVACKHINTKSGGLRWTGSFGQMSLASYGSRSEAFSATFRSARTSFNYVVVVAQVGNIIMVTSETFGGQPNLPQFEGYVTAAIAKVHGTVTTLGSAASAQASATTTTTTTSPPPPPSPTTTTVPPPPPPTTTPTTAPGRNTAASAPPGIAGPVPNVVGQNLSAAEATLLGDNLGYQTESSGLFGVVIASDWTVCSQSPSAGAVAASVNLVVARSC